MGNRTLFCPGYNFPLSGSKLCTFDQKHIHTSSPKDSTWLPVVWLLLIPIRSNDFMNVKWVLCQRMTEESEDNSLAGRHVCRIRSKLTGQTWTAFLGLKRIRMEMDSHPYPFTTSLSLDIAIPSLKLLLIYSFVPRVVFYKRRASRITLAILSSGLKVNARAWM